MKKIRHSPAPYAYSYFLAFLLSGGGALYFNLRFGMKANGFLLLSVLAIYLALIQVFDRFKKRAVVLTIGLLLLAAAFTWVGLAAFPPSAQRGDGETILSWWLLYNPRNGMGYDWDNALLTLAIFTLLAGLMGYLLQKFLALRIFCALGVIGALVFFTVSGEEAPFFTLIFALTYLISALTEISLCLSPKRKRRISSTFAALCLLPVSLLTAWTAMSLPRGEDPIDWSFVRFWGDSVLSGLGFPGSGGGGDEFDFYSLGYSESAEELGGNIVFSDDTALKLTFPGKTPISGLRLTGSMQDTYTGRGWERNAENFSSPYSECELDSLELLYAAGRSGYSFYGELPGFMQNKSVTISYQDIATRSAFLPPKTFLYSFSHSESVPFRMYSHGALFERAQRRVVYDASFLDVDYDSPTFQLLVFSESEYRYQEDHTVSTELTDWITWVLTSDEEGGGFFTSFDSLEDTLRERRDWIQAYYTALPQSLPKRIYTLTDEVTQGYYDDYGKLLAIEQYLKENYTYTLTPGDVPEGRDFVDYFLFDNQRGYCTYFATAMAVMARCAGIPTRYVQGFSAQCTEWVPGGEVTCLVQNQEGHAWPEAYLEGIGWIPFEPTAAMSDEPSSAWQGQEPEPVDPNEGVPLEPDDQPELEPESPIEQDEASGSNPSGIFLVCAGATLLLLGILLLLLFIKSQMRRRRYRQSNAAEKAYLSFKKVLLLLRVCGFPMDGGETLSVYAKRIGQALPALPFTEAADAYSRLHYKEEEIGEDGLKKIQSAEAWLLAETKRRFGRLRSFFRRRRIERKAEKQPFTFGRHQ